MKTTRVYNPQTKKVERINTWETVDEDGVINEHRSVTSETYHGPGYVRVFTKKLVGLASGLDKTSLLALAFIVDNMGHSTNVACVNYEDLMGFLDVSKVTVTKTMVSLQEVDAIRMRRRGQWMVNPELVTACYSTRHGLFIQQYQSLKTRSKKEGSNENVVRQNTRETAERPDDGRSDVHSQSYEPGDENIF